MHPLLIPSSHAELSIVANNLAGSGCFGPATPQQFYTKILFGSMLSLTITESIFGISVENSRVIVEKPVLIERVVDRLEGCEIKVIQKTEEVCELNFFFNSKIAGQIKLNRSEVEQKVPPITQQQLYELALCRGVQQAFPAVFGHKFYLRTELVLTRQQHIDKIVEQSGQQVMTADKLTVPRTPRKLALAENSQKLLDWQSKSKTLSIEQPAEWDAHLIELIGFSFLTQAQIDDLFSELLSLGMTYGVEYSTEKESFYLAEVPQLAD